MSYYVVIEQTEDKNKPKLHLVSAKNQSRALAAVTEPRFTVRIAEESELISLTKGGVEVIEAK